ncbi:Gfo/Idh/MocA family protein [Halosegnis marinus]|uniref:Gfo/Idh/MocA family oxidoreductase n=1 Tax=Halosegnis marinus TaxID=3034023 RepID=A0ABD5ZRB1_9EURY|nr:Gfo/Idh/MocA family oxidoreductase [Halosegnis sp. DT85]
MSEPVRTGVVGVGTMGRHHARLYRELPDTRLVGVADADAERAARVAEEYDTVAYDRDALLAEVDAVSVAVPTPYHAEVADAAMDAGTHLLVEKPFVEDAATGEALVERADREGLVLQVGHVERFNPAVVALADIVPDLDLVAVTADRLGPPLDRRVDDGVVLDLMIHDIDVLLSLVDGPLERVEASGTDDGQYATAVLTFESGVVATLTASRVTQEKVRALSLTARQCQVNVDYGDQSVEIHRHSLPEYIVNNGDVRYRHESITEHPTVENGEPLRAELSAFAEAVRTGGDPVVSGRDGLRALAVAEEILDAVAAPDAEVTLP